MIHVALGLNPPLNPIKCLSIFITLFLLLTWIVSVFVSEIDDKFDEDFGFGKYARLKLNANVSKPFPDETLHHINWFLQISDLHISKFYDSTRVSDLKTFCEETIIDIIKPEVVLATGDLTDAKYEDKQGSAQFRDEWQSYNKVLKDTGVTEKTIWLDIRGNHDTFNVPDLLSEQNYFRTYSVKGKSHLKSYTYTHKTSDGDTYTFIAVDACPDPGPKRPFNFFGILSQEAIRELQQFANQGKTSNMTIWFGHYPTSTVASVSPGFRHVLSHGAVYMCGHLHTLGDWVLRMYSKHRAGNLELELGDWKDHRIYRLFAIDHGMFSFTDEVFDRWPVILITNPKHAQFNMPLHEPTRRMRRSSHIRMLVFSKSAIETIVVKINKVPVGNAHHVQGNFYALQWDPNKFTSGIHTIEVHAKDVDGRERTITQPFSLNDTKIKFDFLPRFILKADHIVFAKSLYALSFMLCALPLILVKFCQRNRSVPLKGTWNGVIPGTCLTLLRRLYLLAANNNLFYPLILFDIYVTLGPWFVGEILDGHIGACFAHGLYVKGVYIPGSLTYVFCVLQLMFFNFPLKLHLGRCLDLANSANKGQFSCTKTPVIKWILDSGFFIVLITIQMYLAFFGFFRAYGTMSFLLGPVRTWSIVLAIYLRHVAKSVVYRAKMVESR